jgi:hypothetical protein
MSLRPRIACTSSCWRTPSCIRLLVVRHRALVQRKKERDRECVCVTWAVHAGAAFKRLRVDAQGL